MRSQSTTSAPVAGDLHVLAKSFERSLWALNRSAATIRIYLLGVDQLGRFLASRGMPLVVASVTREHVEEFVSDVLRRRTPATAHTRYRGVQQFFKWAAGDGEIAQSPMRNMRPPIVPEPTTPVLTDDQARLLLKTCEGRDFGARRDAAILRLFVDSGMRRAELAYLKLEDLDLDHNLALVIGKGHKPRGCPFGRRTAMALDRYLRARSQHSYADSAALWLGRQGPLNDSAVDLIVRRRARQAGLPGVHAHMFRHGYAHAWLSSGGQEQDLMMLCGWKSRTMLARYGASAAAERAHEAYRRLSPGDRL